MSADISRLNMLAALYRIELVFGVITRMLVIRRHLDKLLLLLLTHKLAELLHRKELFGRPNLRLFIKLSLITLIRLNTSASLLSKPFLVREC